ncbi:hypothetical protein RUM44_003654 [Polyplax serrata]|uniref:Uncharacterized protein n=1 Tax=Polyplax serrata TaxID=468196 RepID=A0ABR1AH29_POLSC
MKGWRERKRKKKRKKVTRRAKKKFSISHLAEIKRKWKNIPLTEEFDFAGERQKKANGHGGRGTWLTSKSKISRVKIRLEPSQFSSHLGNTWERITLKTQLNEDLSFS